MRRRSALAVFVFAAIPHRSGAGPIDPASPNALYLPTQSRGGAVWQLVGLITRRSQVQILSPQPDLEAFLQRQSKAAGGAIRTPHKAPRQLQPSESRRRHPAASPELATYRARGLLPGRS